MKITVQFFSYFRDLTGCARAEETLEPGATVGQLVQRLHQRFPRLKEMERSTLIAVGLEYQPPSFELRDGDEVSLFPPVQGG
jgi:sulfur-carrier protein